jgi:hypothetical protein
MRQMVITPDTGWFIDPCPYLWPDAYLYSQSCDIHRLGPDLFISNDWFPYMNCNSVKSLKLLHLYCCSVYKLYLTVIKQRQQQPYLTLKGKIHPFWMLYHLCASISNVLLIPGVISCFRTYSSFKQAEIQPSLMSIASYEASEVFNDAKCTIPTVFLPDWTVNRSDAHENIKLSLESIDHRSEL